MSKRFGRNQKRKLREAVGNAERQTAYWVDRHASDIEVLNRRYKKLEGEFYALQADMSDWAQRILFHMGEDTAYAREFRSMVAEPWMVQQLLDPNGRWIESVPERFNYNMRTPSEVMTQTARRAVELFAMFVDKTDDDMRYQRIIKWIVGPKDRQRLYYAIDMRTLHQIGSAGENHPLVRHMLHEMAKAVVSAWKSEKINSH